MKATGGGGTTTNKSRNKLTQGLTTKFNFQYAGGHPVKTPNSRQ